MSRRFFNTNGRRCWVRGHGARRPWTRGWMLRLMTGEVLVVLVGQGDRRWGEDRVEGVWEVSRWEEWMVVLRR